MDREGPQCAFSSRTEEKRCVCEGGDAALTQIGTVTRGQRPSARSQAGGVGLGDEWSITEAMTTE